MSKEKSPRQRLHELLKERGIDCWCAQGLTFWNCEDGRACLAYTYNSDGTEKLAMKVVALTPEQAIAATVGRSCAACPEMDNPDSYIRHLSAALEHESGTCKPKKETVRFSNTQERVTYYCECGEELGGYYTGQYPWYHTYNETPLPNRCPNCGRRIEVSE